MAQGIKATDFGSSVISDIGVTVTRIPVTKNEDQMTGDETFVDGTSTTFTAYIVRKNQQWVFDKEGKIEGGDALLMCTTAKTINVDDKISYQGDTFRVQTVITRYAGTLPMFKTVNLFLVT